jgi:hypothetical protein
MTFKGVVKSKPACKTIVVKKTTSKQVIRKGCGGKKFRGRKSAFIAVSGADQQLNMGPFTQVQYQVEEVDLNNEYNPATSTFRPKQAGIYSLVASVALTVITMLDIEMTLEIRVNGLARISDREHFIQGSNLIDASGLVKLEARDSVQVFARAVGNNGIIDRGVETHFQGVRV